VRKAAFHRPPNIRARLQLTHECLNVKRRLVFLHGTESEFFPGNVPRSVCDGSCWVLGRRGAGPDC
jgi:hypothetical protein